MAREFFKNLPNTTTPLTAPRMNALLDGDEAMGNIVVDSVRSKNLLSFGNWENTANNITCKSENGKITITGTYGSQTNFYRDCNLDLKAGTTYVISKNQSNSDQFYPYFILRSGETQVARVNNTDGYITYTPETDVHIDSIMLYINGASGVNCTLYPQVEIGTTPTDYSEYKGLGYVSGSNSNGNYIKYDDGTLIQWGTIAKNGFLQPTDYYDTVQGIRWYRSEVANQTFPISFVNNTYSITPSIQNGSTGCRLLTHRIAGKTQSSFSIQLIGVENFQSSGNAYVNLTGIDWTAEGRWK